MKVIMKNNGCGIFEFKSVFFLKGKILILKSLLLFVFRYVYLEVLAPPHLLFHL